VDLSLPKISFPQLREALEASWRPDTAHLEADRPGNPAYGQCYPTARVVQMFFPKIEIVQGEVWDGETTHKHFWNALIADGQEYQVDLTWQQFPHGSTVRNYLFRDRETLGDGERTRQRCARLRNRVVAHLNLT
jgi:hypothetical protein